MRVWDLGLLAVLTTCLTQYRWVEGALFLLCERVLLRVVVERGLYFYARDIVKGCWLSVISCQSGFLSVQTFLVRVVTQIGNNGYKEWSDHQKPA